MIQAGPRLVAKALERTRREVEDPKAVWYEKGAFRHDVDRHLFEGAKQAAEIRVSWLEIKNPQDREMIARDVTAKYKCGEQA